MHRKHVHSKTVEVYQALKAQLRILKESKRDHEQGYEGPVRFLVRKNYGPGPHLNYMIFMVKEEEAVYCLAAWEVSASFTALNEDLFCFIKSKMLLTQPTNWFFVPISFGDPIVCEYEIDNSQEDLSFLEER